MKAPVCSDCGQPMVEVGKMGTYSYEDLSVARERKLYQCPECKTVDIE